MDLMNVLMRSLENPHELDWQDQALCKETDPEAFFPKVTDKARGAKSVCGTCSVRADCLSYAIKNKEQHGIWGGLTLNERRLFIRKGLEPNNRNIDAWLKRTAARYDAYIERYKEVNRKYLT